MAQLYLMGKGWQEIRDGNPTALEIYNRHYSARIYSDGRVRKKFCGPGQYCALLMAPRADALFVWRRFRSMDPEALGLKCAVFRNESKRLSSGLILEAEPFALKHWPDERRVYTYISPTKIRSTNPGFCFLEAGWHKAGYTKSGLLRLVKVLIDPSTQVGA